MPSLERSYTGSAWMLFPPSRISPAWKVVCPISVASKVLFPTPFLPSTASAPPAGSASSMSSSTTVSPYPARTPERLSASGIARFAQVHLPHALVAGDFLGGAFDEHLALHQHADAPREAEHQLHVVLDDEDRDLAR